MSLDDLINERTARLQRASWVLKRGPDCCSFADLARFADNPLAIDGRTRAHLASCRRCDTIRLELAAVQQQLADGDDELISTTWPEGGWRYHGLIPVLRWVLPTVAAAAAILVLVIWWRGQEVRQTEIQLDQFRSLVEAEIESIQENAEEIREFASRRAIELESAPDGLEQPTPDAYRELLIHTLEQLNNPMQRLDELRRSLRPHEHLPPGPQSRPKPP